MAHRWVHEIPARLGALGARLDLEERQRATLRSNARRMVALVIQEELKLDAAIRAAGTWSDRWWGLLKAANGLRKRRIELESRAK